jgi:hypothetical protein
MARRLELDGSRRDGNRTAPSAVESRLCRVCGGAIALEDGARPERYPRRWVCVVCRAEYGTTRPASRNY